MARKYRNFAEYLEREKSGVLESHLNDYLKSQWAAIGFSSAKVPNPSAFSSSLSSFSKPVFFGRSGGDLGFDITVKAKVAISSKTADGTMSVDEITKSITMSETCTMSDGDLLGLNLTLVTVGSPDYLEFDKLDRLNSYLVPYLSKDKYDDVAEEFLGEFFPEALEKPTMVDTEEVISNMGLKKRLAPLGKNIFGGICFSQVKMEVFNENNEPDEETVGAGTVLVNPDAVFYISIGSLANTIIHECLHWYLHSKYFELSRLLGSDDGFYSCRVFQGGVDSPSADTKNKYFMEKQASSIAPRILMPKSTAPDKFRELLSYEEKDTKNDEIECVRRALGRFADFFGVSLTSAKIRLLELGFSQVAGFRNVIDGKELQTFMVPEGSLGEKQTYVIGPKEASELLVRDSRFFELVTSGRIVYVNGLFVVNLPKYVSRNADGLSLTEAARESTDSCCLKFDLSFDETSVAYSMADYEEGMLFRGGLSAKYKAKAEISPQQSEELETELKEKGQFAKEENQKALDLVQLIEDHKRSFNDAFCKMIGEEGANLSNRRVAELSFVSESSIRSYKIDKVPPKNTLIAICCGIGAHEIVMEAIVAKAGYFFDAKNDELDCFYMFMFTTCPGQTIQSCNTMLKSAFPDGKHTLP